MRPVQILQEPIAPPFVCLKCGCDKVKRTWFVDFGVDTDTFIAGQQQQTEIFTEAAVVFCNMCFNSLMVEYNQQLPQFLKDYENRKFLEDAQKDERLTNLEKEKEHLLGRIADKDRELQLLKEMMMEAPVGQESALDSLDASIIKHSDVKIEDLHDDGTGDDSSSKGIDGESEATDSSAESDDSGTEQDDSGIEAEALSALSLGKLGSNS